MTEFGMTMEDLAAEIHTYESDTFSAAGSIITKEESLKVAQRILEIWSLRLLDGEIISDVLSGIREII